MTQRFVCVTEDVRLDRAFGLMRRSGDTALAVVERARRARGLLAIRHFERVTPAASRWPTAFCLHSAVIGPAPARWRQTLAPLLSEMRRFRVGDAMDAPGAHLSPNLSMAEAIERLDREGVNALPVISRAQVVGLLRLADLWRVRASGPPRARRPRVC